MPREVTEAVAEVIIIIIIIVTVQNGVAHPDILNLFHPISHVCLIHFESRLSLSLSRR